MVYCPITPIFGGFYIGSLCDPSVALLLMLIGFSEHELFADMCFCIRTQKLPLYMFIHWFILFNIIILSSKQMNLVFLSVQLNPLLFKRSLIHTY